MIAAQRKAATGRIRILLEPHGKLPTALQVNAKDGETPPDLVKRFGVLLHVYPTDSAGHDHGRTLEFSLPGQSRNVQSGTRGFLLPGETAHSSTLLQPGKYMLCAHARSDAEVLLSEEIEVSSGKTLFVALELPDRATHED